MTHIVSPQRYRTKKEFKEAVMLRPSAVFVEDPAIVNPVSGYVPHVLNMKEEFTVTNHPKRTWFARVFKVDGKIKVE